MPTSGSKHYFLLRNVGHLLNNDAFLGGRMYVRYQTGINHPKILNLYHLRYTRSEFVGQGAVNHYHLRAVYTFQSLLKYTKFQAG